MLDLVPRTGNDEKCSTMDREKIEDKISALARRGQEDWGSARWMEGAREGAAESGREKSKMM